LNIHLNKPIITDDENNQRNDITVDAASFHLPLRSNRPQLLERNQLKTGQ